MLSQIKNIQERIKKWYEQKEKDDSDPKIGLGPVYWEKAANCIYDIEAITKNQEELPIIEIGQNLFEDDYLTFVAVVPIKLCGTSCDEMQKFTESRWKGMKWNGFKGIRNSEYVLIFYRNPNDFQDIPIKNDEEW